MAAEETLFEEAAKAKGFPQPRLPDNSPIRTNPLFKINKDRADRFIRHFRPDVEPAKAAPSVIVDYLDSAEVGAWAYLYKDNYFIAINYGTILLLEFMFNRLLSSRIFMPQIGDIQQESESLPEITVTPNFNHLVSQVASHGLSLADYSPKDDSRRVVAEFLTETSIMFLMGHEFCHVRSGHCDYYDNNFNYSYIIEEQKKAVSVSVAMKQQAMEWHADTFSFYALLKDRLESSKAIVSSSTQSIFYDHYSSPRKILLYSTLACAGLFRVLDYMDSPVSQWSHQTHPPSRIRRLYLLIDGQLFARLLSPADYNDDILRNIDVEYVNEFEIKTMELWNVSYEGSFGGINAEEFGQHLGKTIHSWNAIVDALSKYSYKKLEKYPTMG